MLDRLKLILFLVVLFIISGRTQTIRSIEISGNTVFDKSEYLAWSGLTVSSIIDSQQIDTALMHIAQNLSTQGYFNANFSGSVVELSKDTLTADVIVIVDEGQPTFVRKILINSPDSSQIDEIPEFFEYLEGRIFNKSDIEAAISRSLKYFEDNGFPFASIKISSINFIEDSLNEEHFADVHLAINKDLRGTIDRIEVKGNTKTNENVIIRELRIELGELYSQKEIDAVPSKLNRLRFFELVPKPQFYYNSKEEGTLLIEVTEKQTNNFDGVIGYIPASNVNEKGYVTGLVNISLRNIFGTGRSAAIRWQRLDRNSQELELKYLEPWMFGYPFNAGLSFNQRKQDTTYIQRKFEGSIDLLATETITMSVLLATESIIPSENFTNVFSVYNSSSFTSGLNLRIDTRDDPYAPTEGIFFNNSYSYSRKKINGPAQFLSPDLSTSINLQRIILNIDFFYEVFRRQIAALKLNGRELRGSFFEISDLFRLGGTNTLRGYREDQFLGSRIFWSNLEYRLLLANRTYTYLFFDTGYYLVKEDSSRKISKQEAFKIGYGLGINLETSLGVIGVSFALAKGDSFSDGKIHFGLLNEF